MLSKDFENYMNPPVDYEWTEEDVVKEYLRTKNKKRTARISCLSVSEVTKILKNNHVK